MNNKKLAVLTYLQYLNPSSLPVPWLCGITPYSSSAVITISQCACMALAYPLAPAGLSWTI